MRIWHSRHNRWLAKAQASMSAPDPSLTIDMDECSVHNLDFPLQCLAAHACQLGALRMSDKYTLYLNLVNPYKPSVLFVGHRQSAKTQIRRRLTRRLISFSTVCLQNSVLKFE